MEKADLLKPLPVLIYFDWNLNKNPEASFSFCLSIHRKCFPKTWIGASNHSQRSSRSRSMSHGCLSD